MKIAKFGRLGGSREQQVSWAGRRAPLVGSTAASTFYFLPLFILSIPFFAPFHPLTSFFSLYLFPPLFLPISVLFISFFGTFSYFFPPFPPSQSLFFFAHSHSLSPIFLFARFCPLYHYLCPFSPSVCFSPPFSYPQSLFLHVFFPSHPFRCPFFIPFLFFLLFSLSFSARFHSFCIARVMPSTISPPPSDSKHFWGLADPQPLTLSTDFSALCSPGAISCPEFGLILHCTQCSQLHFCDLSVPLRGCDSWMGLGSFGGNHIHSFFCCCAIGLWAVPALTATLGEILAL